jgi:hypothetical protein
VQSKAWHGGSSQSTYTTLLAVSSEQLLHGIGRFLVPARQLLRRQRRPVVDHGDDPPRSLVLDQDVDKLPRGHLVRDLGETNRRIELSLHVEADTGPLRAVSLVVVLGVLDEVPASLPVAAVVLSVELERGAVLHRHLGVRLDGLAGNVEDAVGAHLCGDQFFADKVGAHTGKSEDPRPHGEAAGRRDLLAGRQDDFFGVGVVVVRFRGFLVGLAAQGSHADRRDQGFQELPRKGPPLLQVQHCNGISVFDGQEPPQGRGLFEP